MKSQASAATVSAAHSARSSARLRKKIDDQRQRQQRQQMGAAVDEQEQRESQQPGHPFRVIHAAVAGPHEEREAQDRQRGGSAVQAGRYHLEHRHRQCQQGQRQEIGRVDAGGEEQQAQGGAEGQQPRQAVGQVHRHIERLPDRQARGLGQVDQREVIAGAGRDREVGRMLPARLLGMLYRLARHRVLLFKRQMGEAIHVLQQAIVDITA